MGGQLIPHSEQFMFRSFLFKHFGGVIVLSIVFLNNFSSFIDQLAGFL